MADTKISEMTAATSLADADLVPVVQGGVNKRGTVDLILDGITAARVNTALGYTAANDAALNASNLTSGTVPDARFPATLPAASGVNLTNLVATNIATGLVPTARLGGGTASSSTYLRGDQTWATVTAGVDGSGTANQIPTWSDTDTLAGSKMTASGTNSGTWTLYDDTATVGVTRLIVRAGAGQGTTSLFEVIDSGSASAFKVNANGSGDIGISDAATNTVTDALILRHETSGTPAAGYGTGLLFQAEGTTGSNQDIGGIKALWNTTPDGNRDSDLKFYYTINGTLTEGAVLSSYHSSSGSAALIFPDTTRIATTAGALQVLAATDIVFGEQGVNFRWTIPETTGHFVPYADNTYDIGNSSYRVKKVYAVENGVQTANGAQTNIKTISESITLATGGLTTDSTADLLPANSLILAVTARVTTTITTTTDWALGDTTTPTRFSDASATLTAGTTVVGVNHQKGGVSTDATGQTQTAAAKLRITCTGANPGAGVIRVTVTYLSLTPPTS